VSLLNQVANDLVVNYPFFLVLLLLLFQNQFCDKIFVITIMSLMFLNPKYLLLSITLTDKKLLQLFVTIIDAKLFEAVHVKDFEAIDIEHTDQCSVSLHVIAVIYIDWSIDARYYPRE